MFVGKWYDSEVDFLAIRQDTRKYYQVTLRLMDESVKARELAPLIAIRDNYQKSVISMDKTYTTDHEGIRFENVKKTTQKTNTRATCKTSEVLRDGKLQKPGFSIKGR